MLPMTPSFLRDETRAAVSHVVRMFVEALPDPHVIIHGQGWRIAEIIVGRPPGGRHSAKGQVHPAEADYRAVDRPQIFITNVERVSLHKIDKLRHRIPWDIFHRRSGHRRGPWSANSHDDCFRWSTAHSSADWRPIAVFRPIESVQRDRGRNSDCISRPLF